jgi:hypothetical protein
VEHNRDTQGGRGVAKARRLGIAVVVLAAGLFVFAMMWNAGVLRRENWTRETPLVDPVKVVAVKDGALTLEDGRVLRPAGISPAADVAPSLFDEALRAATLQGVVVTREFGDGRALLLAEPKFYNWCGTCGCDGWMGTYYRMPLSEAMVFLKYATIDTTQDGMTARERWRIEGANKFMANDGPARMSMRSRSFRYESDARFFVDPDQYDQTLELIWTPPPAE